MARRQDMATGAIFLALGLFAAREATAWTGATGLYPLVLGLLLALAGGIVMLRAMGAAAGTRRDLIDAPARFFTTIGIGALYVALVVPAGFYTASLLLMIGLPVALGFRRWLQALAVGLVFIAILYGVFSMLLQKPLPRELPAILLGAG